MFSKIIDKTRGNHGRITGMRLLPLFLALVIVLVGYPTKAHAQIIGALQVNIPFPFYAGHAKFPAGKYVIRTVNNTDLTYMEISTPDGSTSALFEVRDSEANAAPAKNELIFNKYGNQYFLAKVFDEGNPNGSRVDASPYEKKVRQTETAAEEHVPAQRSGQKEASSSM